MIAHYNLPEDCELKNYDGELVLVGIDLNADRFKEIKAGLPSELQENLIGWRRVIAL